MSRPRLAAVWTWLAVLLGVTVCSGVGKGVAQAQPLRPPDAPRARAGEPPALPSDYSEVDQDGIRFAYHPSTLERIRPLFERAGAIRAGLAQATGAAVLARVEVRVAAVPAEMVRLAPGDVPAEATSVAFFAPRLVVMTVVSPTSPAPLDVESALAHALAHLALDEAVGGAPVPAWFHEGFAIHAEGSDLGRRRVLVEAAVFGAPPSLEDLVRSGGQGEVERAHAEDFVRFLASTSDSGGHTALPMLCQLAAEPGSFDSALVLALDAPDRPTVEARWRADRARRHAFVPVLAALLGVVGMGVAVWRWADGSRRARAARERRHAAVPVLKVVRAPVKTPAASRLVAGRGRDAAIHVLREPEVPKVEHNGKWHTLH